MSGYQTIEALRPILHPGPPSAPVVDRRLVEKPDKPRRGKGHPLKASQVKEIIRRREAGEGIRQIARAMGISHQPVCRYTQGIEPPTGGWVEPTNPRKAYNVEKAHRLRRAGFTFQEIGDEIGCSLSQARVLIGTKERGGRRKPIGRFVRTISEVTGFRAAELRRHHQEGGGRTTADLAKARHVMFWLARHRLGWSYPTIALTFGGFDHSSIFHGVKRTDAVARSIDLGSSEQIGRIARRLWNADWSPPCR